MPNYVKEYLVRLGFESDQPAFRKLDQMMALAEQTVNQHTSGMIKDLLKVQIAIVGGFTAISTAIITMADRIAMTDQKYRLMGQRMMMTTESARKLDMIAKALGTSLEEASWDKETHQNWMLMAARIDKMSESMGFFSGGKGEAALKGIRQFHNAFATFGVQLKFLGMGFVSSLFQKLFPDGGVAAMSKITEWLDKFQGKLPALADTLATKAVPILKMTWLIFKDLGEVIRTGALAFTNLIGLFTGDSSIVGATFDFDKFAKSLLKVATVLKRIEDIFIGVEGAIAHCAAALSLFLHGDLEGAAKHMQLAGQEMAGGAQKRTAAFMAASAREDVVTAQKKLAAATTPEAQEDAKKELATALAAQGETAAAEKEENESFHYGQTALLALPFAKKLYSWGKGALGARGGATAAAGAGLGLGELLGGGALVGLGGVALDVGHSASWLSHYSGLDYLNPAGMSAYNKSLYGGGPAAVAGAGPGAGGDLPGALAKAIAQIESGGNPRALNYRNNNPGNLRRWGNTPIGEGNFAKFATMEEGEEAELHQINKLIGKGLTLREMLGGKKGVYGGWAPRSDNNDPDAYAASVAKRLGIDPDVPLSQLSTGYMGKAGASAVKPAASNSTQQDVSISLGGIYVTRPNAEPHEIQAAVRDGVRDGLRSQTQFDMAQVAPAW
jgi:hypothetical protein